MTPILHSARISALLWSVVLGAWSAAPQAAGSDVQLPGEVPQTLTLQARPELPATPDLSIPPGFVGSDYRIGRQDLLDIKVFDVKELDQTVRVADDGSITMPLLGRLLVGGLTKTEVERLIAGLLAERYVNDPQVTVFVKEYESKRVAVSGAVKSPGTYEMLGSKTLLEMISMAGGLDDNLGREIIIFRRGATDVMERIPVNLEQLVYAADPALNVAVSPGDIIYIPELEMVRIFVSGAVKNPNLYEVPRDEPVTVLKAITIAGGTTDRAAEKRIQIMRTDADGQRVTFQVDLRKIKRGRAEDPILRRDDIVLVPEAFF